MSSDSTVQSKTGKRRALTIAEAVGLTIALVTIACAVQALRMGALQFTKEARVCTRCGAQTVTKIYSAPYLHLTQSRLCSEPLISINGKSCMHDPELIGSRYLSFGWERWKRTHNVGGYPDGDPLYTNPTLRKAFQSIAKSNGYLAQLLVRDIYRLRKANADFSKVLPSLQSSNTKELVAELKGYDFYEAATRK